MPYLVTPEPPHRRTGADGTYCHRGRLDLNEYIGRGQGPTDTSHQPYSDCDYLMRTMV
jgi:hypothetical protein